VGGEVAGGAVFVEKGAEALAVWIGGGDVGDDAIAKEG